MRSKFVSLILTVIITVLSIAFVFVSFKQILMEYRYSDIVFLAQDSEIERGISSETVNIYARQASSIVADLSCRSDILKAGLAILLIDLGNHSQRKDYNAWAGAIEATREYIVYALTCQPTDGDLWLRLAMVSRAVAEQPIYLARLLKESQRWAPAEAAVISGRIEFYNRLTDHTLAHARVTVIKDLVTALRFDPKMVNIAVKRPSLALLPYIVYSTYACGHYCKPRGLARNPVTTPNPKM